MSGYQTWIIVCDGEGCVAMFADTPTDKRLTNVRDKAKKAGWSFENFINVSSTNMTHYLPFDRCPSCVAKGKKK